jgi:transposase InsO family protein
VFFTAHGIKRLTRIVTDNGSCYRSAAFTRSLFESLGINGSGGSPPRRNGKVERYNRIPAEELLYTFPRLAH